MWHTIFYSLRHLWAPCEQQVGTTRPLLQTAVSLEASFEGKHWISLMQFMLHHYRHLSQRWGTQRTMKTRRACKFRQVSNLLKNIFVKVQWRHWAWCQHPTRHLYPSGNLLYMNMVLGLKTSEKMFSKFHVDIGHLLTDLRVFDMHAKQCCRQFWKWSWW